MTPSVTPEAAPEQASQTDTAPRPLAPPLASPDRAAGAVPEIGGRRDGTEPTRFGDWEKSGRCIDF